ncbi:hypothetical protein BsWGS_27925 [Bradybaena similaris]
MATLNGLCCKQQIEIEFLVAEKETVENTHKHLCTVYGSCAVDRSTIRCWAQRIKASASTETELHDLPCSGHPTTETRRDTLMALFSDKQFTSQQLATVFSHQGKLKLSQMTTNFKGKHFFLIVGVF